MFVIPEPCDSYHFLAGVVVAANTLLMRGYVHVANM